MDIYPSTTEGQVCIIYAYGIEAVVGLSLGNVVNQRIYTDGGAVIVQQGNYIGLASSGNQAGIEVYRLFAPAEAPTFWSNWSEGDRIIEQFNAAGCIAEASK